LMTDHLPTLAKLLPNAGTVNLLYIYKVKDISSLIAGSTASLKNPGVRPILLSLPGAVAVRGARRAEGRQYRVWHIRAKGTKRISSMEDN
jgi:hypothetical protein